MEVFHSWLMAIGEVVDLIGVAIVLIGALKFLVQYTRIEFERLWGRQCADRIHAARQLLGGYILVALEFMIVSDVARSIADHSLPSLAELAGVVLLRTAMGFFLQRELAAAGRLSVAAHE